MQRPAMARRFITISEASVSRQIRDHHRHHGQWADSFPIIPWCTSFTRANVDQDLEVNVFRRSGARVKSKISEKIE